MLWLAPSYSGAADLDFEINIVCELEYLQMCEHGNHSCNWGEIVDIDGKQILSINIKEKDIALFVGETLIDRGSISSISAVNDVLYLHGTNPDSKNSKTGTGWMARIGKAQGNLSGATLADKNGYLIYGVCRNQ